MKTLAATVRSYPGRPRGGQHRERVEERRRREEDVQVGDDASQNDQRADRREQPATDTSTIVEEPADPTQKRQQGQTEGVVAPQEPGAAPDGHAREEEIAADDQHAEPQKEGTDTA